MPQFTAGKEILSYCSTCKHTLAHIIVSMKDPKTIHRVECKTCKKVHAYRNPSKNSAKIRSSSLIPGGKKKVITVSEMWESEMAKTRSKSRPYNIRESFEIGDIIDHKKFGPGIVQTHIDGNIEVLFRFEIKTLVHQR